VSAKVESGATRQLLDLVYEYGQAHFKAIEPAGDRWRLVPRDPGQAKLLALRLRHPRLRSATAVGESIEVELTGQEAPTVTEFFLDVGPFEQDTFAPGKLVLRRREPGEPRRIEFVGVATEDEEWRRFLARDVDLIPALTESAAAYLREVPSVRIVPYRNRQPIALIFGPTSTTFSDPEVRRAVSGRLARAAIAKYVTGTSAHAVETRTLPSHRPLSGPVRLVFHEPALDVRRAVLVVEQQLVEMGFEVHVEALEIKELLETLQAGSYDAFVFYGGHDPTYAAMLTTGHDANAARYSNPALDAAVKAGNLDEAKRILEEDVPLTPLYYQTNYVAADRRFCGVRPTSGANYNYLADVHLCAEGEAE